MEERVLHELGFSQREVKVYLCMLDLGQSTVGPIAAKTRMQHSKVYQTLNKLIDKGLVSFVIKSKTKHFEAQDPKHILNSIKEKERRFSEILPELQFKRALSKEQQVATVYEGYNAIKAMFNSILDELHKGGTYYIFALKEDYHSEECLRFLRNLHMNISEKRSDNRIILHNSVKKEFLRNSGDVRNIKHKFTTLSLPPGLMIINDKVINWSWGERPTAVEISSKQIARQYKRFFLEVWDNI
jgi:sugar-specific transcriptional regulator TrmB